MNSPAMAKAMIVALKSMGIEIDNFDTDSNPWKIYISVPKTSDRLNANGKQMAGHTLGKRIKELLRCHDNTIKVFYKIRDDHWSKEQEKFTQEETLNEVKSPNFFF